MLKGVAGSVLMLTHVDGFDYAIFSGSLRVRVSGSHTKHSESLRASEMARSTGRARNDDDLNARVKTLKKGASESCGIGRNL